MDVPYDIISVMHYPWYGFAIGEDPTMTDIKTGEPVQKPRRTRISTLDAIQLQKMYQNFCPKPLATAQCADGNGTYLLQFACDQIPDCVDGSDEVEEACGQVCADLIRVSVSPFVQPQPEAVGRYLYSRLMLNGKQVYKHVSNEFYLYANSDNSNWQLSSELDSPSAIYYASSSTCPYDLLQWHQLYEGNWIVFESFKVEIRIYEPVDLCKEGPCDVEYETCTNTDTANLFDCTLIPGRCPAPEGDYTDLEGCITNYCPQRVIVEGTEPTHDYDTILGTYEYKGLKYHRPIYEKQSNSQSSNDQLFIVFNPERAKWTISVAISQVTDTYSASFVEVIYQRSTVLCPSTFGPVAPWMILFNGTEHLPLSPDLQIRNNNPTCDELQPCSDTEICVSDLGTILYDCFPQPCSTHSCPRLGEVCTYDEKECLLQTDDRVQSVPWHGEKEIADFYYIGGYRESFGGANALFDNEYHEGAMYHSQTCSDQRGVVINFKLPVTFDDILIFTRTECCRQRYRRVCVYADGVKISCTPAGDFVAGDTINFKDYLIEPGSEVIASEFKLMWDLNAPTDIRELTFPIDIRNGTGDDEYCAQIEELFFYYAEEILIPAPGRRIGTMAKWGPEFNIEFDIRMPTRQPRLTNVLQVTSFDPVRGKQLRMPQVQIPLGSMALKFGARISGEPYWVSTLPFNGTFYGTTGWNHVAVRQMFDLQGNLQYHISVNGVTVTRVMNKEPVQYTNVILYLSNPWQTSATHVQLRNLETSFPIVRCGPVCEFQKETCPKAPVLWKGMKYSKLLYGAVGAVQLRLTILNNQKDVVDIRTERFTAFLMFAKSRCGDGFLNGLNDGKIQLQLYDVGYDSTVVYELNYIFKRGGPKASATVQFRRKNKPAVPPIDLPSKKTTRDQLYLGVTGLESVLIPDFERCFGKGGILIGVMSDSDAGRGTVDWTPCVAWQKPRT